MRICGSLPQALISEPHRCEKLAAISAIALSILAVGAFAFAGTTAMHPATFAVVGVGGITGIGVALLYSTSLLRMVQEAKKTLLLKDALKVVWKVNIPEGAGVTRFESGTNKVFEIKDLPGVILKVHDEEPNTKEIAEEYVRLADSARQICQDLGLKHIHIPPCGYYQVEERFVVWQEKVPNQGDFQEQAGFFEHAFKDPAQCEHMLECFRDLTKIVCTLGISDIKANNLLYTPDGKIALIDLDNSGAVVGLCRGWAEDPDNGVLQIIPSECVDEFVALANQFLSERDKKALSANLAELRVKVEEKSQRQREYTAFLGRNRITQVRCPVEMREIEGEEGVQSTARAIVASLNSKLLATNNPDLEIGREVQVSYMATSSIRRRVPGIHAVDYPKKIDAALEALKNVGVIFSYSKNFGTITVKC